MRESLYQLNNPRGLNVSRKCFSRVICGLMFTEGSVCRYSLGSLWASSALPAATELSDLSNAEWRDSQETERFRKICIQEALSGAIICT